jgi:hypothetical protein
LGIGSGDYCSITLSHWQADLASRVSDWTVRQANPAPLIEIHASLNKLSSHVSILHVVLKHRDVYNLIYMLF